MSRLTWCLIVAPKKLVEQSFTMIFSTTLEPGFSKTWLLGAHGFHGRRYGRDPGMDDGQAMAGWEMLKMDVSCECEMNDSFPWLFVCFHSQEDESILYNYMILYDNII